MPRHEKVITLRVKRLQGLQKIAGLIGKSKPESVYFQTRWGIHTFGLRFPIDVIILDKKNRVVAMKESLQPNQIFIWNPRYSTVIELPEDTIDKKKLVIGMIIDGVDS